MRKSDFSRLSTNFDDFLPPDQGTYRIYYGQNIVDFIFYHFLIKILLVMDSRRPKNQWIIIIKDS